MYGLPDARPVWKMADETLGCREVIELGIGELVQHCFSETWKKYPDYFRNFGPIVAK